MVQHRAEGDDVESLLRGGEKVLDGVVDEGGGLPVASNFGPENVQHVSGDIHNGDLPAAAQHLESNISGTPAAVETANRLGAQQQFAFNDFQILFNDTLKKRIGRAVFVVIIFYGNLAIELLVGQNDLVADRLRCVGGCRHFSYLPR